MVPKKDIEAVLGWPPVFVSLKIFPDGFVIVKLNPIIDPVPEFSCVITVAFVNRLVTKKTLHVRAVALAVHTLVTYKCPTKLVPVMFRSSVPPVATLTSPVD